MAAIFAIGCRFGRNVALSVILTSGFPGLLLEYDHINYILTIEQLLNMEAFTYKNVLGSGEQIPRCYTCSFFRSTNFSKKSDTWLLLCVPKLSLISTLEYLITVQHPLNVHNGKLDFIWLAKKDNLMLLNQWYLNEQFKPFSINLNAQHVNGMTPFD